MPDARELIGSRIRQRIRVQLDAPASESPYAPDHALRDDKLLMHRSAAILDVDLESARQGRGARVVSTLRRYLKALLFPVLDLQNTHNQTSTRISTYLLEQFEAEGYLFAGLEGKVDRATSMLEHLDSRIELLEHERTAAIRLVARHALAERSGISEADTEAALRPVAALLRPGDGRVVDLGCGRGVMLGLLEQSGIDAYGVDLDLGMISRCQQKGLDVVRSDIVTHLLSVDDRVLGGVVAGGLAEEWPLVRLVTMVRIARRKLAPGAPLLLHGPDPLHPEGAAILINDPLTIRGHGAAGLAALLEQEGFTALETAAEGRIYVVRAAAA
jgi:hypothetical protein